MRNQGAAKRYPIERGRWLKYGFLSGEFMVFTGRRVVNDHGDGTATFEVVDQKFEVDKKSVLQALRDYQHAEKTMRRPRRRGDSNIAPGEFSR